MWTADDKRLVQERTERDERFAVLDALDQELDELKHIARSYKTADAVRQLIARVRLTYAD